MNWAASHLATRAVLQGLYKMEGFCRKKGGARMFLTKENKGLFLDQYIFCGEGNSKDFYHTDCLFFLWWMEKARMTDYLIDIDQKIPDWLRLYFWERPKQHSGQVLNLGLVSWALAKVMPFWACGFLFNKVIICVFPDMA
ncbi:hypothetical protein mRhiFer1_009792 [Rhinolophus ferrumequinum]|uniref:Uncharacterized protein n=1 Tax=Rhinolophus ferrumequinum TaxID=59479 RepID=A0A7J7ZDC3_RHIFE|nr:hypothetical protein mRhiFer1_009792 [Rhinolophus ferrumequinum]